MQRISHDDKRTLMKEWRDFLHKSNLRQTILFEMLNEYGVSTRKFNYYMLEKKDTALSKEVSDAIYNVIKACQNNLIKDLKPKIDEGYKEYSGTINQIFYVIMSNQLTYKDFDLNNHRMTQIKRKHRYIDIDGIRIILATLYDRRYIDGNKYIKWLNFMNDYYLLLRKYLKKIDLDELKNGYYIK